jgi:putative nucleotidyltransferase with HDIG domain
VASSRLGALSLQDHASLVDTDDTAMPRQERATHSERDSTNGAFDRRAAFDAIAAGARRLLRPSGRGAFLAAEALILAAVLVGTVALSRASEWQPALLVALLLALSLLAEWFTVELSEGMLSASLVAIVLAMSLLGPGPAAACGITAMVHRSVVTRLRPAQALNNLATFAAVPFAGGLLMRLLGSDVHSAHDQYLTHGVLFGLITFGVFLATLALNFLVVGFDVLLDEGQSLRSQLREFRPLVPGQLAAGALAAMLAVAYTNLGLSVLFASIVLLLIFQHLTVALVRSEHRAEQLEARSIQLVGLQLGVLRTLVKALGMRDTTTARHAAAVARYAKALAIEAGCSEEEQETVHTAGLLHDIGKFTWPDRILHAAVIDDGDREIVERHPQDGAMLVGALDGYGAVADAILYHHERVDGGGYPAGLIGKEIPLGSRILAICSNFNTITARESYRAAMSSEEAFAELRSAARNGQLDAELVEQFIALVERERDTLVENADFETELEFDRRVRQMASPDGTTARDESRRRYDGFDLSVGIRKLKERALAKN